MRGYASRLKKIEQYLVESAPKRKPMLEYQGRPKAYIEEVLGQKIWSKQEEVLEKMMIPPHKVLVESAHSVGKSFLGACLINYFYDCYDPGLCVTTAPTSTQVRDVLWAQVRILRKGRTGFIGNKSPEMWSGPDHYAKGMTANSGEAFAGRHPLYALWIFDEATGIKPVFWQTTSTMFDPQGKHYWVCFYNPLDTSCQAYVEANLSLPDGTPAWHRVQMGAQDHPNLKIKPGETQPYPSAVSIKQWEEWIIKFCDPVHPDDVNEDDIEWPIGSNVWYRPSGEFQSRALGLWPSTATLGIWSERLWNNCMKEDPFVTNLLLIPEIGCDVAWHGHDYTSFVWRWGKWVLGIEKHNGWEFEQTAGRLKQLCAMLADMVNVERKKANLGLIKPQQIPVKVDGDVNGGAVLQFRADYKFLPVCASSSAWEPLKYPNRRCELWFTTRDLAREGLVNVHLLPKAAREILRRQCMAPVWKPDGAGRRMVEKKEETKKRLQGASPDDADALNLCFAASSEGAAGATVVEKERGGSVITPRQGVGKLYNRPS